MANPRHLEWLLKGAAAWNTRQINYTIQPNFEDANLAGALEQHHSSTRGYDLIHAIFRNADLSRSYLNRADLSWGDFRSASLESATLVGAKLERANLGGANLRHADLRQANLTGAILVSADLQNADLSDANLRDADVTTFEPGLNQAGARRAMTPTDLSTVRNLSQQQLDSMNGDSGTILPPGLTRPAHWPDLDTEDSDDEMPHKPAQAEILTTKTPDTRTLVTTPFVFLSYAHADKDRAFAQTLRDFLRAQECDVWWDDDILPGKSWADAIQDALRESAAVVTIWTTSSAASPNVTEEARVGQSAGKLVPVMRETAELPYGFSETQWAKLQDWDGTPTHWEMQKVLQALRDKLSPPDDTVLDQRHAQASPTGFVVEQSQFAPRDTPPNIDPKLTDEVARDNRLEAVFRQAQMLRDIVKHTNLNVGPSFDLRVTRFLELQESDRVLWDILQTESAAIIRTCCIPETGEVMFGEIEADVAALRDKVSACRDYIEPRQAAEGAPDAKPVTVPPNLKGHEADTATVAGDLERMLATHEAVAVLNPASLDVFERILTNLRGGIEAHDHAATRHAIERAGLITARLHADLQNGTFRALLGTETCEAADVLQQRVVRLLDLLRQFFR